MIAASVNDFIGIPSRKYDSGSLHAKRRHQRRLSSHDFLRYRIMPYTNPAHEFLLLRFAQLREKKTAAHILRIVQLRERGKTGCSHPSLAGKDGVLAAGYSCI
jgi:hypothetical protein